MTTIYRLSKVKDLEPKMCDQSEAENQPDRWPEEMAFEIAIDIPYPQFPFNDPKRGEQGEYESFLSIWPSPDASLSYLDSGGFSNALRPPDLEYAPSHVAEGAGIIGNHGFPFGFDPDQPQFASVPHQPILSLDGFVSSSNPVSVPGETETVIEKVSDNAIAGR